MDSNTQKSLTDLSRHIYGTTRLGDSNIPFADRIAIARKVIEAGGWIHTSNQYNDALQRTWSDKVDVKAEPWTM